MKPSVIEANLNEVQQQMSKMSLLQLVNHEYINSRFHGSNRAEIIAQFKENYLILVSDAKIRKALEGADHFSILTSLISITKDGLSINPDDKEACIVNFAGRATPIPMAYGRLKKMQINGIINRIQYLEIIYVGDKYSNENGVWKHSINLTRPENSRKLGVLLMVLMPDKSIKSKYVSAAEVLKRKEKSEMKEVMWKEWEEEMWKKTAIIMFEKEIGKKPMFQYIKDADTDHQEPPVIQTDLNLTSQETEDVVHEDIQENVVVQNPKLIKKLEELIAEKLILQENEDRLMDILPTLNNESIKRWIDTLHKIKVKRQEESQPEIIRTTEPEPLL